MTPHNHLLNPVHQPYLSPYAVIARNWPDGKYCPNEHTQKHLAALAPYILESLPVSFLADNPMKLPITWSFGANHEVFPYVRLQTFLALEPTSQELTKFLLREARPRVQPPIDFSLMTGQILASHTEAAIRYRSEKASLRDA